MVLDPIEIHSSDRAVFNSQLIASANTKLAPEETGEVEQCGFLITPQSPTAKAIARVEMLGGEFCGNATRSAVFVSTKGKDSVGTVECSGAIDPLEFKVAGGIVHLTMPLPNRPLPPQALDKPDGLLVTLDGIAHLVQFGDFDTLENPRVIMEQLCSKGTHEKLLSSFPTLGVSQYSPSQKEARFCVWVKAVDTVYNETACGSGTSAIGIAFAHQQHGHLLQDVRLQVRQPSGQIIETHARVDQLGTPEYSAISGGVNVLYDGPLDL